MSAIGNGQDFNMKIASKNNTEGWQQALRMAVRRLPELLKILELNPSNVKGFDPKANDFPLLVPHSFIARMRKGDPNDPLLLQILPQTQEHLYVPGFTHNPLLETDFSQNGVVQKYAGRALLITTEACPVHCRYCFRRHFPYSDQLASKNNWAKALAELEKKDQITEVILSGGDPLTLSNRRLAELISQVELLKTVTTLRIHTRFPIILPERIDPGLLKLLSQTRLKTVLVVHSNHANEIDEVVYDSLQKLRLSGAQLLNQSVLLRGINDDVSQLENLSRSLFKGGVLPYYLNLLDPVEGAAHFDVDAERAKYFIAELRHRLPGYLVPRLVREVPGGLSKKIIA
jgi:EF-P beta-lysylation protein EpmB|tara:strand:+ start:669 stop:1700 length:1032 start_codon:yes stop_codon:yes gene_type:complete